ncbi:MAG: hypothetical protein U5K75_09435 [Ahrensia sp.]|nr:hypothetical protein [Ahrensia sp.]
MSKDRVVRKGDPQVVDAVLIEKEIASSARSSQKNPATQNRSRSVFGQDPFSDPF